jgi:hypothetical protein
MRESDKTDPAYQSPERIERGSRALECEYWENVRDRDDDLERRVREGVVKERAAIARNRALARSR